MYSFDVLDNGRGGCHLYHYSAHFYNSPTAWQYWNKGKTSCVWQSNTRLIQLLPNLPSEVGHIFLSFHCRGGNANANPELSSYGFKWSWITRVLHLLQGTGLDCWANTQASPQRLQERPEEGNLVNISCITRVEEPEPDTTSPSTTASLAPAPNPTELETDLNNGNLY